MTGAKIIIVGAVVVLLAVGVVWAPPIGPMGGPPRPVIAGGPIPTPTPGSPQLPRIVDLNAFNAATGTPAITTTGLRLYPFWNYQYGYGNNSDRAFVLAERRGKDVQWFTMAWDYQVTERVGELQAEWAETNAANVQARVMLPRLKREYYSLVAGINGVSDPARKAALKDKLAQTELAISSTEAQIKPPVQWVVAGPYGRYQVNDFLVRLQQESGPQNVHPGRVNVSRTGY